jgi:hypothetical protein
MAQKTARPPQPRAQTKAPTEWRFREGQLLTADDLNRLLDEVRALRAEVDALRAELAALKEKPPAPRKVIGEVDVTAPSNLE